MPGYQQSGGTRKGKDPTRNGRSIAGQLLACRTSKTACVPGAEQATAALARVRALRPEVVLPVVTVSREGVVGADPR
eukprot:350244-Rhodomonas_salina.1